MTVKQVMRHSSWICWKDLVEFSRSKLRLILLVLMPLFMMVMVGYIFPSGTSISHQPVALANEDVGNYTLVPPVHWGNRFVENLTGINNNSGMMDLSTASGFDEIKADIQDGKLSGGIIVPPDFTQSILSGKQGVITIVTDQSNPQISSMMQAVLSKTIEMMGTNIARQNLNTNYNITMNNTLAVIQPYTVQFTGIVPGQPNYFEFVAPGIISMVVMMSLMTGLPHAISYEKDMGTLDGMLVAPINRLSIILGKVMAQTVRGLIQGAIIVVLAVLLFGVVIYGSILLVVALLLLTVFSFVGMGILITSFTGREETATMIMMTLMFPMMFLSGVFFPIQQMPAFMQDIAHLLPLTYAAQALRKVMVLGAGLDAVSTEILILFAFGLVLLAVAVPMFKKAMSR
jgi:ABC-2 type transport system permease protein